MVHLLLIQGQKPPPPFVYYTKKNSCPPVKTPWLRILQTTPQSPKSLCSTDATFEASKLLLTTSLLSSSWAQMRFSPRHSSSSSLIMAGNGSDSAIVTGEVYLIVAPLSSSSVLYSSGSRLLSMRCHLSSSHSMRWSIFTGVGPRFSCPFGTCQTHLF